jgi:hypothetical protein
LSKEEKLAWSFFLRRKCATLYLHFPCFDGIISGVVAILFLEKSRGWKFKTIEPVNYGLKKTWLDTSLPQRSAVVDFLYHPQAEFWADHHPTTFLTDEVKVDFEQRKGPCHIYDKQSGSCASLLWRNMGESFHADRRLEEMVRWAEKIDSAAYDSVEEALSSAHPALILSKSLAIDADHQYCTFLITRLRSASLQETAQSEEVQKRLTKAQDLGSLGLERVRQTIQLEGDVAVFEANSEGALISRYSPYYFYPKAQYSIGVTHTKHSIVVTAMRNPWLDFESLNLGEFVKEFGGGGHQRVGSVVLGKEYCAEADTIVEKLLEKLNRIPERLGTK